jgi:predicted O-methyltransferase YrrM
MHPSTCPIGSLHERLNLAEPCRLPDASLARPLNLWRMEEDDVHVLRYLYSQLQPRRHLEFGTWQGFGAVACLESCDATVWSINLRDGEERPDGVWAYYTSRAPDADDAGRPAWVNTRVTPKGNVAVQTDGAGFIGRLVHERGLGHRFCQVYCDSRAWDVSQYPAGFFDTALIDGGHSEELVVSDTRKALQVVRPGGLLLWHDYCLDADVAASCESVGGVLAGIGTLLPELRERCRDLFWISPSWLLAGVVR